MRSVTRRRAESPVQIGLDGSNREATLEVTDACALGNEPVRLRAGAANRLIDPQLDLSLSIEPPQSLHVSPGLTWILDLGPTKPQAAIHA